MSKVSEQNRRMPSWSEMHSDTALWAEKIQLKHCREAPAWRKLEMVGELTNGMLHLAQVGIRDRYPNASSEEVRRRLADMILGPELASAVYGPLVNSIGKSDESGNS